MRTALAYKDDRSDKIYVVEVKPHPAAADRFTVITSYGRRGGSMQTDEKGPFAQTEAVRLHDALVKEKVHHRKTPYRIVENGNGIAPPVQSPAEQKAGVDGWQDADLPGHMLLNEITVERADRLIEDESVLLEPKYDGTRGFVGKTAGGTVGGVSRTGKPLALPEGVVSFLAEHFPQAIVLDGELIGDSLVVFDILKDGERPLWKETAEYRVRYLIRSFKGIRGQSRPVVPTVCAFTREEKEKLYRALLSMGMEGAVFKHKYASYTAGRPNNADNGKALKYKFVATASVISGGQRPDISVRTGEQKRSVKMYLADGTEVGSVTIPPNKDIPPKGQIIEVRYLYRHDVGGDLVQAVYLGPRHDVRPQDCTAAQLRVKGRPKK